MLESGLEVQLPRIPDSFSVAVSSFFIFTINVSVATYLNFFVIVIFVCTAARGVLFFGNNIVISIVILDIRNDNFVGFNVSFVSDFRLYFRLNFRLRHRQRQQLRECNLYYISICRRTMKMVRRFLVRPEDKKRRICIQRIGKIYTFVE